MRIPTSHLKKIITSAIIIAGAWLGTALPGTQGLTAALTITALLCWITGIIPEYLTALMFFTLAMLLAIAPSYIVFSGFNSAAFWLVFSGLVLGVGINGTGLGKRIAGKIATHLGNSYFKLINGLVCIGLVFGFFMPSSMGRVVLLVPIGLALADYFGFKKDSNGFVGIMLAIVLGSFIPAFAILPANVPNMILIGMTETLYDYSPLYGEYLLLHFPVLGLIKAIVISYLILWLYPDQPTIDKDKSFNVPNSISKQEILLSIVLLILIVFWLTDFIHHISPAWIALAGACFILLPKIAIVTKQQFCEKINYASLFLVAGILGIGGVINYSGLGNTLTEFLVSYLPLKMNSPFTNYMSLGLGSMLTGIATTLSGVPAVLTPLSGALSSATGLPLKSVFMTQVIGFSIIIFPYQAPPLLIGMQLAKVKLTTALKVCAFLALISAVVLMPLNFLWWKFLGWV